MKKTLKIAKNELRNLFYSPVAWFLLIVFLIQCAFFYCRVINVGAVIQDTMAKANPGYKGGDDSLTKIIFMGSESILDNALNNLYLFVPLLTMGLISREINNGTIKLLYSSPVKLRQLVLGKYLALMMYNLLLLSVTGIFMIAGLLTIRDVDYGLLLSAALGFYLLLCCYTAIGMFMSSLTTYPIVSAISTFVLLFVLDRIGGLWQQYDLVRDLTWNLSMQGRTDKMIKGLITTREVVYFILITCLFISFTIFRLKGSRETRPWYLKATRYIMAFALVLMIGYLTSRPGSIGYLDATAGKVNTINDTTQQILRRMGNEPVEITLYANLLGSGSGNITPQMRNHYIWNFWEKYIRFNPNIQLKYVEYYDVKDGDSSLFKAFPSQKTLPDIVKQYARLQMVNPSRYMPPAEIRKMIDLSPEDYHQIMQVKYKGRTMFLRTFPDGRFWPDEDHVAAVMKQITENRSTNVYYVTGNLERDIYKQGERQYENHTTRKAGRKALVNRGFRFDTLSLEQQDIPADADILVLADPKTDLKQNTLSKLHRYIREGGNMMILGEPGKQQVINPVLLPVGIAMMPGTIVEITKDEMPQMIMPYATMAASSYSLNPAFMELKEELLAGKRWHHLYAGASGITRIADSGSSMEHLVVTYGRNAWAKAGNLVVDSAAPVFVETEGDYKRDSFTVGASLRRNTGNKEQRIIVYGDADFMSKKRVMNNIMWEANYSWLDYLRYPIYLPKYANKDVWLNIKPETAALQGIIFVYILPATILILSAILLIRRKRK